ncbi:AMP-binding protein [Halobaculum sp. MBLA0147]|uniref:AMP-binding protein n=1 Tax=Halobaculum sp. MBLA0147 TaxID=3079934 RepID=UPI00352619B2
MTDRSDETDRSAAGDETEAMSDGDGTETPSAGDETETPSVASTATTVGDLVARDRRRPAPALHATTRDRTYSYFDLCNTAAKAGNVLRHVGVRPGDTVAVDPTAHPESVLTALGAGLIGATVTFDPAVGEHGDARALVVHTDREEAVTAPPGTSLVVFGAQPTTEGATHWETEVWSENPMAPPAPTGTDDPAVAVADETVSHRTLLATAGEPAPDPDTAVVLATGRLDATTYGAGVIAPLAAGGVAVVTPAGDGEEDGGRDTNDATRDSAGDTDDPAGSLTADGDDSTGSLTDDGSPSVADAVAAAAGLAGVERVHVVGGTETGVGDGADGFGVPVERVTVDE